jgi:hypothetical protein
MLGQVSGAMSPSLQDEMNRWMCDSEGRDQSF